MNVQFYTRAYDAVIQGIRKHTNNFDFKYVGMALAGQYFPLIFDNYCMRIYLL
jgi:hypothetical protein